MMETIIRTEGLGMTLNSGRPDEIETVKDVSIEIARCEIAVIKGPSGSGKTSLLSLIGCMSRPSKGKILVNGKDAAKLPERFLTSIRQNTFGFIFQQLNLVRDLSVIENVMLPLYPTDMKPVLMKERAEHILGQLGIAPKKGLRVQALSGGEQQRVAIARALVNDPEIIIADEPTAHLDTKLSEDLTGIFRSMQKQGKTIVIATHDPIIYKNNFVDRLMEMRDGMVNKVVCR